VEPSRTWIAGERVGPTIRKYESNGWALESQLLTEMNPEAHLQELFRRIPDQIVHQLRLVTSEWKIQFSLVLEMQDETPPFNLRVDTLQRIASLGASLDVDMYLTGGDAEA